MCARKQKHCFCFKSGQEGSFERFHSILKSIPNFRSCHAQKHRLVKSAPQIFPSPNMSQVPWYSGPHRSQGVRKPGVQGRWGARDALDTGDMWKNIGIFSVDQWLLRWEPMDVYVNKLIVIYESTDFNLWINGFLDSMKLFVRKLKVMSIHFMKTPCLLHCNW